MIARRDYRLHNMDQGGRCRTSSERLDAAKVWVIGNVKFQKQEQQKMNYTYLLKCADDTLYCGWTNQLDKRLKAHNEGKGAKYTRARRPVSLAYYEIFETKEEAMRREAAIKKLSRKDKLKLVAGSPL
ncbi:GIY-YIG nuclease family protein [Hungatella sp.]|uniref:GIY-YIG nuclease family protein n=1 Tax=Hungatella sp. TaxID=2613924 RepID=UPI002A805153|nr:GIY-YIG nuclease family protein [Hungatella sp.]